MKRRGVDLNPDTLQALLRQDLCNGGYLPDSNPEDRRQFAMRALDKSLLKKFHNEMTDDRRDAAALAIFRKCNENCLNYTVPVLHDDLERTVYGEMKSMLYDFFFPSPLEQIISYADAKRKGRDTVTYGDLTIIRDICLGVKDQSQEFRHVERRDFYYDETLLNLSSIAYYFGLGNGSNIGARSTDFYTKYVNSTMACTDPQLHSLFVQAISNDDLWSDIEAYRSTTFGVEVVKSSRLSFVPKSKEISRTICTEPILNMLFQKGIGGVLTRRLKDRFGIDLSTQPDKNRRLAQIGSQTGNFGTIDLSSASDTISLTLLEDILPAQPLRWLKLCRTPSAVFPDGSVNELHMISSMGNGFTFPLQTLIFAALVNAVYKVLDIRVKHPKGQRDGNYGVFGDDIIVLSQAYDLTMKMLSHLGFVPNHDKSFNEGDFRESCGRDYYRGFDVRGVYIKRLLTENDSWSAINRLNRWSATHGIVLPNTCRYLLSGCRLSGVPFSEADDAGIKIPERLANGPRRDSNGTRWYWASVNVSVECRIPSIGWNRNIKRSTVVRLRRKLPNFDYYSNGLVFVLLAGYLRSGRLGIRQETKTYVLKECAIPCWDHIPLAAGITDPAFFSRWESAVELNLFG